jgi:pilus assembly protein CpaE
VINAKGGSGASFIACNLAHIASVLSDADADIVLVDFDLQFGTQSLNLDVKPLHTIVEALNDIDKLDFDAINGYMTPYKSGLSLLSTQPEQLILPGEINAENGDKLLTLLTSHYDHIFIDLPRYIDALFAIVLERSDQIIIIIQLTVAHVHDAKRLINILKSEFNISAKNILIVVNRYDANSHIDLDDVKSTLQSSNVYMVPTDFNNALQSSNLGIPIYDYARNSPITRSLTLLLKALNVTIKENSNYKTLFKNLFTK